MREHERGEKSLSWEAGVHPGKMDSPHHTLCPRCLRRLDLGPPRHLPAGHSAGKGCPCMGKGVRFERTACWLEGSLASGPQPWSPEQGYAWPPKAPFWSHTGHGQPPSTLVASRLAPEFLMGPRCPLVAGGAGEANQWGHSCHLSTEPGVYPWSYAYPL